MPIVADICTDRPAIRFCRIATSWVVIFHDEVFYGSLYDCYSRVLDRRA